MKKKIIVAIADGVGRSANVELGSLTPLQYAAYLTTINLLRRYDRDYGPHLTRITKFGTDMGHLILFGNASVSATQDADRWKQQG